MEWYLPLIWAALIGTAVAMYLILDGFDLGLGILFPFAKNERERDQMVASVASAPSTAPSQSPCPLSRA